LNSGTGWHSLRNRRWWCLLLLLLLRLLLLLLLLLRPLLKVLGCREGACASL
jgi:hypothetical protein